MSDLQAAIRDRFQAAGRILVASHVRPDGDAVGSLLGLGLALQEAGKSVSLVLSDGLPDNFRHLPGSEQVRMQAEGAYDLIVSVDVSDLKRLGTALDGYRVPDVVIDHHLTTADFGGLNLIDPAAVATASVLARCLPGWGLKITPAVAANLLTGIVTDTLGFRTSNVTPEALRQAADLLELGADLSSLYFRSLVRRTFPAAKYWGAGLGSLQRSDGLLWASLTLADRSASGYAGNDDADLINVLSAIDDADAALMFVEQGPDRVKVSWRGLKPDVDVAQIARQFNGGGHKAASGAELEGTLTEVQEKVLAATRNALNHSR